MKEDFRLGDHGLRKLRVATLHGLVFAASPTMYRRSTNILRA
jgi:hypothetical protein